MSDPLEYTGDSQDIKPDLANLESSECVASDSVENPLQVSCLNPQHGRRIGLHE